MVQHLSTSYVFKYPFHLVTKAYFNKYTSGQDENVKEVVIIEQCRNFVTGINYYKRLGRCANVVPSLLTIFFNEPNIYFEEEIWLNRREKTMSLHTRNLSFQEFGILEERSVYKVSSENPNWTSFEQRGSIEVKGMSPILNSFAEKFSAMFFSQGGKKGLNIMEDLLQQLRVEP